MTPTYRLPRSLLYAVMVLSTLMQAPGEAAAQSITPTYPAKPVRLIVPFPPGSSTDIISRILAQKATDAWGHQVIVENRAGGGGNIGVELAAKSPPDGYTLLGGNLNTHGVNPNLYQKLSYHPVTDFTPITQTVALPLVLVVHPSLPVRTVKDLTALARSRPGQLNYASGGSGSAAHLAVEYFKLLAKVDFTHIPHKGTGPALTDLLGGHVSLTITGLPPLMPHLTSGKLRGLAVTTAQRVPSLPALPTMAESGLDNYAVDSWQGLFAPAGTPAAIVAKINRDIAGVLKLPDVRERLSGLGAQPVGNSPEQFAAHVKTEIAKWARVVKAARMTVD